MLYKQVENEVLYLTLTKFVEGCSTPDCYANSLVRKLENLDTVIRIKIKSSILNYEENPK